MKRTLHLIVEGDTDVDVVKALLKARKIDVNVRQVKDFVISKDRAITRLADNVEELILLALKSRQSGDCIVVLHDADELTQTNRVPYQKIADVCKKFGEAIVYIVAKDEIEAWLLADSGMCKWLAIKPQNNDEISKPSGKFAHHLNDKRGIKYQGRNRSEISSHVNGDGDKHSPSMREAFQKLKDANCL